MKQLESDDGSAFLAYEGLNMSHDLSGEDYLLRVRQEGRAAEARARIRTVTSSAAEDLANKQGVDLSKLDDDQRSEYRQKFADEHGHRLEVILFEVVDDSNIGLAELSRLFCMMYLEIRASFKYNHPDYPESGEGYYPDQVYFCPYDVDRKLYMTLQAGEGVQ